MAEGGAFVVIKRAVRSGLGKGGREANKYEGLQTLTDANGDGKAGKEAEVAKRKYC
jgi:hypothetical protein